MEDDTAPPVDSFELLRQHADPDTRPVVHGLSFSRTPPYAPSIWRVKEGTNGIEPIWDWEENTLYRIAHSGTCVSLFHVSVFEKLERPWFRMQPFEPGCEGMIPCTSLSRRMHEAGVPIYGFTGCIAGHMSDAIEVGPEISQRARAPKSKLAQAASSPEAMEVTTAVLTAAKARNRRLVLGVGTGRCGSQSLARLLDQQLDSKATHELLGPMPWLMEPGALQGRIATLLQRNASAACDVAFYHLPHTRAILEICPDTKFICLVRPVEEYVQSALRHTGQANQWQMHDGTRWDDHYYDDKIFPKYQMDMGREDAVRGFWEEYNRMAQHFEREYPEQFHCFPTDDLNSKEGVRRILEFVGFPEPKIIVGIKEGKSP